MHPDVHSAALRAAAKVAFSAAFLGACSGATAEAPAPTSGSEASEGTATTDVVAPPGGTKTPPRGRGDAGRDASTRADAGADAGPSNCEAVVASAFADAPPNDFPGVAKTLTGDQSACCVARLEATQGLDMDHRFDCCASLEHTTPGSTFGNDVGTACTPWGPPVPPPMIVRRRVDAESGAVHV